MSRRALLEAAESAQQRGEELIEAGEPLLRRAEKVAKVAEKEVVRRARQARRAGSAALRRSAQGVRAAEEEVERMARATGMPRETLLWAAATPLVLLGVLGFARVFPPLTAVLSGPSLYSSAWFSYEEGTKFDTSPLTWGTDFVLAVVNGVFAIMIARVRRTPLNQRLVLASALLIGSYSLSTLAGALAHLLLHRHLNSAVFRAVWRVCVGSVAAAGGFMGAAATEINNIPLRVPQSEPPSQAQSEDEDEDEVEEVEDEDEEEKAGSEEEGEGDAEVEEERDDEDGGEGEDALLNFRLPAVPQFFWISYSVFFTMMNTVGFFSMKRPACDIFLVGVTQAPPTLYLVLSLYARKSWAVYSVGKRARRILLFGALTNILLLPGYDLMNFADLNLGLCNLIMHTTLLVSWGSQAYGLLMFARGLSRVELKED